MEFAEKEPTLDNCSLSKVIAKAWHKEPADVKAYWKQKEKEVRDEHRRLHPAYKYAPTAPKRETKKLARKPRQPEVVATPTVEFRSPDVAQSPAKEIVESEIFSTESTDSADKLASTEALGNVPTPQEVTSIALFSPSISVQLPSPQPAAALKSDKSDQAAASSLAPEDPESSLFDYINEYLDANPTIDILAEDFVIGTNDITAIIDTTTDTPADLSPTSHAAPADTQDQSFLDSGLFPEVNTTGEIIDSIATTFLVGSDTTNIFPDSNATIIIPDNSTTDMFPPVDLPSSGPADTSSPTVDVDEFINTDMFQDHLSTSLSVDFAAVDEESEFDFDFANY
ncbi:repressor RFG1/ROX1 [Microdochium nivale]|nr:repressor RFG1/ROX1 [Microdochium nivale]